MDFVQVLVTAFIGYAFGCFQTAYIIGKLAGKTDIRSHGTGNAGASNITIVLGWKYGVITAIVDIAKAFMAVLTVNYIYPASKELLFLAGAFAILGHIFPAFLRFKGGKGAASLIGMVLAIDFKIAVIAILAIVAITLIIDYIALGSIAMFAALPISTYYFNYPLLCTMIGIGLALLCLYKHSSNIKRIIKKEEIGLRRTAKNR